MNKWIIYLCFFWPITSNVLNIQDFAGIFVSLTAAQLVAYSNVILLLVGIFLILKRIQINNLSKTAKLWIIFYFFYYIIATIAAIINDHDFNILVSLISVIYFISFYLLLSIEEYRKDFFKVITFGFVISSILTIILFKLNFDMGIREVYKYSLHRAQGVYGDANNTAMVAIIAFILFYYYFKPKNRNQKIFKVVTLLVTFYALTQTFSTTGLTTFTIVFLLLNHKFFTKQRVLLLFGALFIGYIFIVNLPKLTADLNLSVHQQAKIENLANVLTLNFTEVDTSGRTDLLQNLMQYIYKNPFLGNGVDFFVSVKGHNTYFGIWADAGVFAFIFFISILFIYMVRSLKIKANYRFFCVTILLTLYIFMISLQSVLNQPYAMVLFVYIGYLIDNKFENKIGYDY